MRTPAWWDWELELTDHVIVRMEERDFTEIDLRAMLNHAISVHRLDSHGRWLARAPLKGQLWKVILEPDVLRHRIVVITAHRAQT
jgi:hypothetical protein